YALAAFLTVFLDEVKSRGHNQRSIGQCLKTLLQDKTALLFVVSMALVGEVVHVITVFLNQSQYVRSGIEAKYFGLLVAMVQCASLMSVKASRISGKFGNMPTINSFTLLIILSSLILAITTNPVFSITCVVVLASSLSIITPIATDVQNKRLTSGNRATMLSIYSMLGGLVASMGDIAVGKMTDYSLQAGFLLCMVLGLIALSLSFVFSIFEKRKKVVECEIETFKI
ncbi:MAG: hypothetical protein JXO44_05615, partial [Clostridia bacterium]|nr:hypothetical protein [Clostridia bacterium]